jgi:hypothetical protein
MNEPRVYVTEKRPPISHEHDLTPVRSAEFVVDSSHSAWEPAEGAYVGVQGPRSIKYEEASHHDPGALFDYSRPEVTAAFKTKGALPAHLTTALALAHKHSMEKFGAKPQVAESVSPQGHVLSNKAVKSGFAEPNPHQHSWDKYGEATPERTFWDTTDDSYPAQKPSEVEQHVLESYQNFGEGVARYQVEAAQASNRKDRKAVPLDETKRLPAGSYEEGRAHARDVITQSRERRPGDARQFSTINPDQLELFK